MSARPQAHWNWVEGDDKRVSWTDVYSFFIGFELGESVGGDDGFVRLLPSERNKSLLSQTTIGANVSLARFSQETEARRFVLGWLGSSY